MTIDIYVSPSLGNDSNPGSLAQPIATLEEAESRIPNPVQDEYLIHLRGETYPLPSTRSSWFRSRTFFGGKVVVFADEVWDPAVYTVVASGAAAEGTTSGSIATAGSFMVNAHRGRTIRFTSGAAAGQHRRLNGNTASNFNVNLPFSPGPESEDSYEVITPNAVVHIPAAVAPVQRYTLADKIVGPSVINTFSSIGTVLSADQGLHFKGLKITSANSVYYVEGGPTYLIGVDLDQQMRKIDGALISGVSNDPLLEGWGLRALTGGPNLYAPSIFHGYFHGDAAFMFVGSGASAHVDGGFCLRVFQTITGYTRLRGDALTPFLIAPNPGSVAIHLNSVTAILELSSANVLGQGAGIILERGSLMALSSSVIGGTENGHAMDVLGTARLLCTGAPAFGSPTLSDWRVRGLASFNKSALAVVGATMVGTDQSLASRVA